MALDPTHLSALAAILRLGSFDAAAAALGVTPSAISQRVKALEEKVGATLVHRGQPAQATALGARLAKHAEDIALLEAQALGNRGMEVAPAPRLTLAVPADSLATWLIPALAAVPDLFYDLRIDDQDTSHDWLRNGAVSAALTGHDRAAPGCDVFALGALRYVATASPAFVARYFDPDLNGQTLMDAPMLTYSEKDQLQNRWIRKITGKKLLPHSHQLPSSHGFVDAALCGLGWGMNPLSLVGGDLASGRLVALGNMTPLDVPLYWQVSRVMAPALSDLTRSIRQIARKTLLPLDKAG